MIALRLASAVLVLIAAACDRRRGERTVYSSLPEAHGVREGTPINFRGLEVGRVGQVALTGAAVRLTLRITRADMPLRSGDRVAVLPVGLFGDEQVEIVPGPMSAAPAVNGATLQVAPPDTVAMQRAEVLDAIVRAAFDRLTDSTRQRVTPVIASLARKAEARRASEFIGSCYEVSADSVGPYSVSLDSTRAGNAWVAHTFGSRSSANRAGDSWSWSPADSTGLVVQWEGIDGMMQFSTHGRGTNLTATLDSYSGNTRVRQHGVARVKRIPCPGSAR